MDKISIPVVNFKEIDSGEHTYLTLKERNELIQKENQEKKEVKLLINEYLDQKTVGYLAQLDLMWPVENGFQKLNQEFRELGKVIAETYAANPWDITKIFKHCGFEFTADPQYGVTFDKLMAAIVDVYDQRGDDLCWMDIDLIFKAAGLPVPDRRVGDQEAMLKNCRRFVNIMCKGGSWKSYAELEQENWQAQSRIEELEAERTWMLQVIASGRDQGDIYEGSLVTFDGSEPIGERLGRVVAIQGSFVQSFHVELLTGQLVVWTGKKIRPIPEPTFAKKEWVEKSKLRHKLEGS